MDAVRKLPVTEKRNAIDIVQRKTIRTVAITFAAAAACLGLVLLVSPQLLGRSATKDSSMSAPMASSASDANVEMAQDGSGGTLGSETNGDVYYAASSPCPDESTSNVQTEQPPMALPSAEPGAGEESGMLTVPSARSAVELLEEYYAVFYFDGELPDIISDTNAAMMDDGTEEIEIPVETAVTLLENGYSADIGNENADTALIVYTMSES
jgi:hypothetical protein